MKRGLAHQLPPPAPTDADPVADAGTGTGTVVQIQKVCSVESFKKHVVLDIVQYKIPQKQTQAGYDQLRSRKNARLGGPLSSLGAPRGMRCNPESPESGTDDG